LYLTLVIDDSLGNAFRQEVTLAHRPLDGSEWRLGNLLRCCIVSGRARTLQAMFSNNFSST
jgi:hypothetical protein